MSDSGSIVLGWLTKLVIWLSVLGLIAFDGIALVATAFSAADHANTAATAAAAVYKDTRNADQACKAAQVEAEQNSDTIACNNPKAFQVTPDGHVHLVLHRTATTLWLHRISFLKKYTDLTGDGDGAPPA